jgi:hypothetical protein
MPLRAATPEEIGGSIEEDEVLVYHIQGPYRGMTLAMKNTDVMLVEALHWKYAETQRGGTTHSLPTNLHLVIKEVGGALLDTSPSSYPHPVEVHLTGAPRPGPAPTKALVVINKNLDLALTLGWFPLMEIPGQGFIFPYAIPHAGHLDISVELDNGDWAEHVFNFNEAP